jgi:hypothetical protein
MAAVGRYILFNVNRDTERQASHVDVSAAVNVPAKVGYSLAPGEKSI